MHQIGTASRNGIRLEPRGGSRGALFCYIFVALILILACAALKLWPTTPLDLSPTEAGSLTQETTQIESFPYEAGFVTREHSAHHGAGAPNPSHAQQNNQKSKAQPEQGRSRKNQNKAEVKQKKLRANKEKYPPLKASAVVGVEEDFLLEHLLTKAGSDKAKAHGYQRYYNPFFVPMRRKPVRLVEIGVESGRSVAVWQLFFMKAEHIYGIGYANKNDWQQAYKAECQQTRSTFIAGAPSCTLFKGDQSSMSFLNDFKRETGGGFDIVVDDGSHVPSHQRFTLEQMWSSVNPGGIYTIEDIETSYWSQRASIYGYPLKNQKSFIEHMEWIADNINREFMLGESELPPVFMDVSSIAFGQNCVTLQKKTRFGAPGGSAAEETKQALLEPPFSAAGSGKAKRHEHQGYYAQEFAPLRDKPIRFVEVGVRASASLPGWQLYFTNARHIYGLDRGTKKDVLLNEIECRQAKHVSASRSSPSSCTCFQGDQSSISSLHAFKNETGGYFDVFVDGGSHDKKFTFEQMWPSVRKGGIYAIEDAEPKLVKHMLLVVDVINRLYMLGRTRAGSNLFRDISSIVYGQGMIIVRKQTKRETTRHFRRTRTYHGAAMVAGHPLPYP